MPMVPSGHKTLVRYPDGTSTVITLYTRPLVGQVIAHGWEVTNVEAGVEVCAPVHDAVLIAAPIDQIEADVDKMRAAMAEASRIVLDGFELGVDSKTVRYPERYMDDREGSLAMWDWIWAHIEDAERKAA